MLNFSTAQGRKYPPHHKTHGKRKKTKQIPLHERRTDSFSQAAIWALEDRNLNFPTEDPDRLLLRGALLESMIWADELVMKWAAGGSAALITVRFESLMAAQIGGEALAKCFEWYKIQEPSLIVEVGND
jgi:hypothetical protein